MTSELDDGGAPAGVVLITGVMAAGKSTVAELLASRLPRAAHVRGDTFRRAVVSGRAEPSHPLTDEAAAQLRLRYALAAGVADGYAAAGFVAVLQDIVIGPALTEVLAMIRTRPRRVVVLDPDPDAVGDRETGRPKSGYGGGWTPELMVAELRSGTPRTGLWLDTTGHSAEHTVERILDRFDEALVP